MQEIWGALSSKGNSIVEPARVFLLPVEYGTRSKWDPTGTQNRVLFGTRKAGL